MAKKRLIFVLILTLIADILLLPLCSNNLLNGIYQSSTNKIARIDIYNKGSSENKLKVLEMEQGTHNMPEWCGNDDGNCVVIQSKIKSEWHQNKVRLKAIKDGVVTISLRGSNKEDNGVITVDYKDFSVNGKQIFNNPRPIWYDVSYPYSFSVNDGDEVEIIYQARRHHFKTSDLRRIYGINFKLLFTLSILSFLLLYKLVGYVAKFKLIENNSRIDIVFLCVFFVLLFIPMSHISDKNISVQENRVLAAKPLFLDHKGLNLKFGSQFDRWFNDRFRGRKKIIQLHHNLEYNVNKIYRNSQAIYFKNDDWMFGNGLPGSMSLSYRNIDEVVVALRKFDDFCLQNHIKLYLLVLPEKNIIYQEYIRKNIGFSTTGMQKYNELMQKISSSLPNGRVIVPQAELEQGKQKDYIFFKTAHHWTDWGAYIGYKALMEQIKKDFPDIKISAPQDYDLSRSKRVRDEWERDYHIGHTAKLLNISNKTADKKILKTDYTYYDHKDRDHLTLNVGECVKGKRAKDYFYPKGKYRLFLTGISHCENLLQHLPFSFRDVKYMRINMCLADTTEHYKLMKRFRNDITAFHPDILVINVSTGALNQLADIFKD